MRLYAYCLYTFGPGGPCDWLANSQSFHFLIYGILSYPFAWVIKSVKASRKKTVHYIYIICCLVLPLVYLLTSPGMKGAYSRAKHPFISVVLPQLIVLFLWVLRLWLILALQVFIRKSSDRWGTWGIIISSVICACVLYKIMQVFLPTILSRYGFI